MSALGTFLDLLALGAGLAPWDGAGSAGLKFVVGSLPSAPYELVYLLLSASASNYMLEARLE